MESERNYSAKESRQCARIGSGEKEDRGEAGDQKEVLQPSGVTVPGAHPGGEGEDTEFLRHAACPEPEWRRVDSGGGTRGRDWAGEKGGVGGVFPPAWCQLIAFVFLRVESAYEDHLLLGSPSSRSSLARPQPFPGARKLCRCHADSFVPAWFHGGVPVLGQSGRLGPPGCTLTFAAAGHCCLHQPFPLPETTPHTSKSVCHDYVGIKANILLLHIKTLSLTYTFLFSPFRP